MIKHLLTFKDFFIIYKNEYLLRIIMKYYGIIFTGML